jgi:hypothetical protein
MAITMLIAHPIPTSMPEGLYPNAAQNRPAARLCGPTRNSKAKRGRPPGRRMLCGWGRGEQLTGRRMRAHFTTCPSGQRPPATGTDVGGA